MSGLSLGTRVSNLKSVALTILEVLAFNAQKFRGHMTLARHPFGKTFKGSCPLKLFCKIFTAPKIFLDVVRCQIKHLQNICKIF